MWYSNTPGYPCVLKYSLPSGSNQTTNSLKRIRLEKATIAKGLTVLFKDINWCLEPGEHWIISGASGVGKTTLVEFLAYQHRLVSGHRSYPFLGDNPSMKAFREAIRYISFTDTGKLFNNLRNIHYYQQRFNAFDSDDHLTARQYLEYGGFRIQGKDALLKEIGIYDLLDVERIKLSSGQTRKLLLARVLLSEARVLIIDNPYLGLDHVSRKALNDLLDKLVRKTDLNLILSGQHQELPQCISHRLHLEQDGTYRSGEIDKVIIEPQATQMDRSCLEAIRTEFASRVPTEFLPEVLRMEKVSVSYANKEILPPISWRVKRGEKWVVFGPNGVGKSTLLSLIYADNPQAYSKEIYLFGKKRGTGETIWDIKRRIGFTSPELHAYFRYNYKALKVVLTGLTDTFELRSKATKDEIHLAKLFFRYFGVESELEKPFKKCSTGLQRLLLFMRSLIKAPTLLLLDEPFQGLDADQVKRAKLLLEHTLRPDQSLIFISHYRQEWPATIEQVLDLSSINKRD